MFAERVPVADRSGEQTIRLSCPGTSRWVKLEITKVLPRSRFSDTAISGLSLDLEEFNESPPADTNPAAGASKMLVGRWQGARHLVDYQENGTFRLDPEPGDPSLGTWRIRDDKLERNWEDGTDIDTIVSINRQELVIRNKSGKEYSHRRVK